MYVFIIYIIYIMYYIYIYIHTFNSLAENRYLLISDSWYLFGSCYDCKEIYYSFEGSGTAYKRQKN